MIAKFYGRNHTIQKLRDLCYINTGGVSLLGISEAAEKLGFRTIGVKLTLPQLSEAQLPCILHWKQNHFVVLYKIKSNKYHVADPSRGIVVYTDKEFAKSWYGHKELHDGISLLIAPTPKFYEEDGD